jgi:hypothetical protein
MNEQLNKTNSISPSALAVLLALLAVLAFGMGGMLLYCAVQPFGTSPPPPVVCWVVGTSLVLLAIASAFGCYHCGRMASPAVESSPAIPRASAAAPQKADASASKMAAQAGSKIRLRDALFSQPDLQQRMGGLVEALIQVAPEHYAMIHLLVEARKVNGKTSILFTHGTPVLLNEYSTLVPDGVANAAFQVIDFLLRQDANVPGFEIVLRKTGATKWDADCYRLDEPAEQRPDLPRYPLRVCGYGFSLAPPPDTVFRWGRNLNPPAIMAAARKSSNGPFQQVQITFADDGPRVLLRDGVAKAEEVIQLSEGPQTSRWMVETPAFRAIWPDGFDLRYPLASKTRFDLLGADDTLIFAQGPVPNENILEGMAAEGQVETGRGKTPAGHAWIELGYEVGGSKWRQRHYNRPVSGSKSLVVTAQCLRPHAESVFRSSSEFTESLTETVR